MRPRLLGLAVVVVLALPSHLVTKALLAQSRGESQTRGKSTQLRSHGGRAKPQPGAPGARTAAQVRTKPADPYWEKSSWAVLSDVRSDNSIPGIAKFDLTVEAWQGVKHSGLGGDFVAEVDFYPVDDLDGTRRVAFVHSVPLRTVPGKSWKSDIPLVLSMPSGPYKARAKIVGMNTRWVQGPYDAEPVQELPVFSLRTVSDFNVR